MHPLSHLLIQRISTDAELQYQTYNPLSRIYAFHCLFATLFGALETKESRYTHVPAYHRILISSYTQSPIRIMNQILLRIKNNRVINHMHTTHDATAAHHHICCCP